jgi:peptidyl-prolyl cis-trans isomerase D
MERARNWVIIFFALVIGLSMVLFTLNRYANPNAAAATNSEVLASVNGDDITVGDLSRLKENYRQMFGGQINLAQLGGDRRFLDGLIRDRVIAQEAVRLGLGASDVEVAAEIRKQFTDASGKFVGLDSYKERVASQYGSVAAFEETMRNQIAADKLRAFVTASVTVSEKEVEEDYKRKNTMFDLTVVNVSADKLAAKVQPTDDELQKFYDEHKTEFRYFDPQKKIRYLYISQSKVGEKLNIPDADLKAAYDQLKPENKIAGVRAQQIILKVARPDLDTEVLTKATKLFADMGGGGGKTVTAEKFAEVARGNSEDPATARNGGWLPQPVKKSPNVTTAKDPAQHVFDLTKEGEASEPVKYGDAYYIFRRGDDVTKTFEQAKPELLASQRNTRAYKAAADLAARAAARLKETKDFQKVAQELASQANMTPQEMIKETPFVKPGDDVPDIGSSPQFEDAIKSLDNAGDIGDRVSIKDGFAVPSLVEKREPRIPDLSEVKDKIAARVKQEKARGELEATARDVANGANSAADLKAVAEKHGLEATPLPSFHIGTPLGDAGASAAADEAINNLKEGEITKTPIKVGESWVVVGVTKRKDADLAEFAKQRDSLVQSTLTTRRGDVFEDYVGALKSRLERDGKIKIYDDVLARIGESETLDLPPAPVPVPRGSR